MRSPVEIPDEVVEDPRQLEPHEQEQHRVQQEGEDLPDRHALKAHHGRGELRRVPGHVEAGRNGRDHAREAELLGGQVGRVPGEDRDRDLGGRVVDSRADLAGSAGRPTGRRSARRCRWRRTRDPPPRARTSPTPPRRPRSGRGSSAVQSLVRFSPSTIATQPPRCADPAHDLGGRHGVGGRHDRAEHEGLCPAEADDLVSHDRHRGHRHEHEWDRERARSAVAFWRSSRTEVKKAAP